MQSSRALEVASEPWDEGVAIELECLWDGHARLEGGGSDVPKRGGRVRLFFTTCLRTRNSLIPFLGNYM